MHLWRWTWKSVIVGLEMWLQLWLAVSKLSGNQLKCKLLFMTVNDLWMMFKRVNLKSVNSATFADKKYNYYSPANYQLQLKLSVIWTITNIWKFLLETKHHINQRIKYRTVEFRLINASIKLRKLGTLACCAGAHSGFRRLLVKYYQTNSTF